MADITQNFSQLLLTYGPGAMLDLPEHAVVVAGLQDWRYAGSNWRPVEEERLVALLRQQLGAKLSPGFAGLRHPPMYDEDRRDPNAPGVEVRLFPTWFLVDEAADIRRGRRTRRRCPGTEKRRRIVEFADLTVTNAGKLSYKGDAKKAEVNPIRFVGACAKGHLQDIDWRFLAHRNGDRSCRKPLFWVERGVSSDPSDISVRCTCGASVTLADLYKPKFLGGCAVPQSLADAAPCRGRGMQRRPATSAEVGDEHLFSSDRHGDLADESGRPRPAGDRGAQDDDRRHPRAAEFPRCPQGDSSNERGVQGLFGRRDQTGAVQESSEASSPNINPRIAEFDLLASGAPFIGSDTAGSFFYAETLPRDGLGLQEPWAAFLKNVVKVHRLREVTCLYGFTRLEPPPTSAESELDEIQLAVNGADLSRSVEWLPAIEQFGEGIFLHIAPAFLKRWLDSSEIVAKAATLRDRERREAERFNRPPIHLGAAYWALHSLSHAFMAELALECGYPLSSLKERIYSSGPAQPDRFGLLIYTSTAGGQGTLGGLSSMAERVGELLDRATKRLALCSNDPICAEHADGNEDYPLQGAACHACLLVPALPYAQRALADVRPSRADAGQSED